MQRNKTKQKKRGKARKKKGMKDKTKERDNNVRANKGLREKFKKAAMNSSKKRFSFLILLMGGFLCFVGSSFCNWESLVFLCTDSLFDFQLIINVQLQLQQVRNTT